MPALTIPDTGLGTTLSASGIAPTLIKRISPIKFSVGEIETTDLSTTAFKTRRPSDLREFTEVEIEFYWTGASVPITTAMVPTAEPYAGVTATITFAGAGAGSLSGTVFVKEVDTPNCAQGEVMMGRMVLAFDGYTDPAFTPA
jgi:hypothetical protein